MFTIGSPPRDTGYQLYILLGEGVSWCVRLNSQLTAPRRCVTITKAIVPGDRIMFRTVIDEAERFKMRYRKHPAIFSILCDTVQALHQAEVDKLSDDVTPFEREVIFAHLHHGQRIQAIKWLHDRRAWRKITIARQLVDKLEEHNHGN